MKEFHSSSPLTFVTCIDVVVSVSAAVLKTNGAEAGSAFWYATCQSVASIIVKKRDFASGALEIDFISQVIE